MKIIVILILSLVFLSAILVCGCNDTPGSGPYWTPTWTPTSPTVGPTTNRYWTAPTTSPTTIPITPTTYPLVYPFLKVESIPSGATVEVGPKVINGVYSYGTGRIIGVTPVETRLFPTDITSGNIHVVITKQGYIPQDSFIRLESGMLENKIYSIRVPLNPI
jgi:hypothetical protein